MLFCTGDTHSDFHRFSMDAFPEQRELNRDDTMIISGDFGGVWYQENSEYIKKENWWLDWLEDKTYTTVFIDGNHENFDRLYKYPVIEWNGGLVHEIRPHVLHLMRGEVFTIESKKFFVFGGASSHDIQDGILDYDDPDWRDQARALEREGKHMYRVKGLTYWRRELPTQEEMENGWKNLAKHDYKVDFILSHTPPASVIALLGHGLYEQDVLTKYLEEVRARTDFKTHLMGHMHINKRMNERDILLYEQIVRIN